VQTEELTAVNRRDFSVAIALAVIGAVAFYLTTPSTQQHFDYTLRIASALLHGHLGLQGSPPSWLNELVPRDGSYYSVFPLGAVLSLIPVALLTESGLIADFPGRFLAAVIVGLCLYFFFHLSRLESKSLGRRIVLALFIIFGTWAWCNLGFGGAWHIALGFALLGQTGALYFTLIRPRPLVAGFFFALAFGNRTEIILTLPLYLYYLSLSPRGESERETFRKIFRRFGEEFSTLAQFLIVPAVLVLFTAVYNFARFHSVFDFGYSQIPKVLQEPWYQHGLFSFNAIPWNAYKMLFEGFSDIPVFPFIRPDPFGCSIFLSSPFLFLLFREGGKYRRTAWIAIGLLTFVLWCHGNPGGWQFSYRYAIELLPWMFLLLIGNGPAKISVTEISLFAVSVAINAVASYQFLWTNQLHP
jgi:hypothetical protein